MDQLNFLMKKPIPKKKKAVKVSFVVKGPEIVEQLDSDIDVKSFQDLIGKVNVKRTVPKSIILKPKKKIVLKPGVKKTKRKIKMVQDIPKLDERVVLALEVLGKNIQDRLPPKQPATTIIESSYFKENRQIFMNFINSTFQPYLEKIKSQGEETCDTLIGDEFSLLTHQEIVRDYINLYTPYTGLLLYHGLGSGKTCSSIAIAEGIKSHNIPNHKIIVMTPASLEKNYIEELKFCGDFMYKKTQHWEFVRFKRNSKIAVSVSESLSIPIDYANKKKGTMGIGLWIMDKDKPSNYDTLSGEEQQLLDAQINEIQEKITHSVTGVEDISNIISDLNEISDSISSATQEQLSATHEISQNVQEASLGTQEVSQHIQQVETTAGKTLESVSELTSASSQLETLAKSLQTKSNEFISALLGENAA